MRRIVVVRLSALGDLIELTKTINVLRAYWPAAHIDLLTGPLGAELFRACDYFRRVLVWPHASLLAHPLATLRFLRELRAEHYELAVDMHCKRITGYLLACARKEVVVRTGAGPLRRTFLGKLPAPRRIDTMLMDAGEPAAALAQAMQIGFKVGLNADATLRAALAQRIAAAGWHDKIPLVVLAPGSSPGWPSKRWPVDRFRALAQRLIAEDVHVIVVGSAAERKLGAAICAGSPAIHDWTGRTGLQELLALMSLAAAAVTNDSGPLHIAAAVGTPVVALFGPTAAARHGPDMFYGPAHRSLEQAPPCAPCYSGRCRQISLLCMEAITVDEVLDTLQGILNPHLSPPSVYTDSP